MLSKPKYISILDIGSSSIIAFACERNNDGMLIIKATSEVAYDGYLKGDWLSKESLSDAIENVLANVNSKTNSKIKTIYVGVPGEFTRVVTKNVMFEYPNEHMVTDEDINLLYTSGDTFDSDYDWQLINSSAVYYTVDDTKKVIDPRGMIATNKIELLASYIFASATFIEDIQHQLVSKADEVKFLSADWAQAMTFIDAEKRDQIVLLCDIGLLTTSIMLVRGDGIIDHAAFSNGGGYIESDLSYCLDASYKTCVELKNITDLNLIGDTPLGINIADKQGIGVNSSYINNIIIARIEDIADNINDALSRFSNKCPPYIKVYLTGGGITGIKGSIKILSDNIDRAVEVICPSLKGFDQPRYASSVGILEVVARWEYNKISFMKKLFANK